MILGLDYDNTFTRDPEFWLGVVALAKSRSHLVFVVTMRHASTEGVPVMQALGHVADGIFFSGRKAKKPFMQEHGISVDVWIDDMPFFIENNAAA